jgi:hypothetical protein
MGPTPHRRLHVRLRLFGGGARGPGTLRAPPGINPRRGSGAGPSPRGELGLPISRCDTEPIHLMNHRRHMYVPRQRARTPLGHSTARHAAELSALDGGTKHVEGQYANAVCGSQVDVTTVIKRRLRCEYSCATRELVSTHSLRYALAGNAGRFWAAGRAHCSRRSSITV